MAAVNTTGPKTIRKLGPSELFSSSRHHLGIYRCVTVSCRHLHPQSLDGAQISPAFFAALASIVQEQPILRVGIAGEDSSNAHWTYIPQLDLKDHVSVQVVACETVQEYEDKVAEHQGREHDRKWHDLETRPPWRITILRPSSSSSNENESVLQQQLGSQEDVFFSFHHSLLDGTSGREFHEMLLSALATTHQTQDKEDFPTELSFPEPPSLHEPVEAAINFTLSWRFMLGILWNHFGPWFLKPKPQPVWNAKPIDFALPYKTRIKPIDISAETLAVLLDACRKHSVTLTALLHSLVLTSLAKRLSSSSSAAESPAFQSGTPISLRPYLARKPDDKTSASPPLRCLVSTCIHKFSPKAVSSLRAPNADINSLIWENAAQVRKDLAAKLALTPKDDITAMFKFIGNWIEFWQSRDGKARTESWEISNIGVLKNAEATTNGPRATRMLFSNGAMVAGPPIGVDVASVAGSKLTISLSWQDKAVDEALIDQLRSDLRGYAAKLAETGSSFV
ncbi:alcohol acetyltransferase [Trichoderma austrokoningii]